MPPWCRPVLKGHATATPRAGEAPGKKISRAKNAEISGAGEAACRAVSRRGGLKESHPTIGRVFRKLSCSVRACLRSIYEAPAVVAPYAECFRKPTHAPALEIAPRITNSDVGAGAGCCGMTTTSIRVSGSPLQGS